MFQMMVSLSAIERNALFRSEFTTERNVTVRSVNFPVDNSPAIHISMCQSRVLYLEKHPFLILKINWGKQWYCWMLISFFQFGLNWKGSCPFKSYLLTWNFSSFDDGLLFMFKRVNIITLSFGFVLSFNFFWINTILSSVN